LLNYTLEAICKATGGVLYGGKKDLAVNTVSTDSRGDVSGSLFIPISGDSFDGHDYIEGAIAKGAVCALTEREPQNEPYPLIKVTSTRQALMDLAVYERSHFTGSVVAITGSAGKTTTKDMIASVVSKKYNTLKTQGNFNNDIGLPLTLLSRKRDHEVIVLEMGMNHFGEISVLSHIGKPSICLITNIGDAHIENLGSREGILKAKSEIFEGMKENGTVILNGDDPLLSTLPQVPNAGKTIYGYRRPDILDGTVTAISARSDLGDKNNSWIAATVTEYLGLKGTKCIIFWNFKAHGEKMQEGGSIQVHIPLPGDHMIMNALMSFAVGLELEIDPGKIAEGIKEFTPSNHRMAIVEVNGMTIVNDSYNASPSSMKAAVDMMTDSLNDSAGRKVCIFGDMFELGDHAEFLHKEVGQYIAAKEMDLLITIGPLSKYMHEAFYNSPKVLQGKALHFLTKEDFLSEWKNHLRQGDTVLIKASRGMSLEKVAEEIIKK